MCVCEKICVLWIDRGAERWVRIASLLKGYIACFLVTHSQLYVSSWPPPRSLDSTNFMAALVPEATPLAPDAPSRAISFAPTICIIIVESIMSANPPGDAITGCKSDVLNRRHTHG